MKERLRNKMQKSVQTEDDENEGSKYRAMVEAIFITYSFVARGPYAMRQAWLEPRRGPRG